MNTNHTAEMPSNPDVHQRGQVIPTYVPPPINPHNNDK